MQSTLTRRKPEKLNVMSSRIRKGPASLFASLCHSNGFLSQTGRCLTLSLLLLGENRIVERPIRIRLVKSTEVKTARPFASSDGTLSFAAYMLPQGYEADAEEFDGKFLFDVDSIPLTVSKMDVVEITSTGAEEIVRSRPSDFLRKALSRFRN